MTAELTGLFYYWASLFTALIVMVPALLWGFSLHRSSLISDRAFLASLSVIVILGRLPTWFLNFALNEDEAVFLARAATLLVDPVWFRSIDTTSGGPITVYLLAGAIKLGLPVSYFTCRVLMTLFIVLGTISFYRLLLVIAAREIAQTITVLSLSFWVLTADPDLLHLASEMASTVCIVSALSLTAPAIFTKDHSPNGPIWGALLLGIAPWAKLQSSPIALAVGLLLVGRLAMTKANTRIILAIMAAAIAPTLIVIIWSYYAGYFSDLWVRYFVTNLGLLQEAKRVGVNARFSRFFALVTSSAMFGTLAAATLIFWLSLRDGKRVLVDVTTTIAGALLFASFFTLFISGLDRTHYLTFLIYPFLFFVATLHRQSRGLNRLLPALIFAQLALFSWEAFRTPLVTFWIPKNQQNTLGYSRPEMPQLAEVREFFGDKDIAVSVWGWGARLLPALNAYQGNRDSVSVYLMPDVPEAKRKYHVEGFIEDLLLRRPELVVDTFAYESLPPMHAAPLESCKEVHSVVMENYVKWTSIDGAEFYLRKDLSSAALMASPHS